MGPMDLTCKTAESQDGKIKTQFAEEDQEKNQRETVSTDQVLLLRLQVSVMELMDLTCKTVELADGMIRTQSAEEDQEKNQRETVSTDQVLLLLPLQ